MVLLLDDDSSPARGPLDRLFPRLRPAPNLILLVSSYCATTKTLHDTAVSPLYLLHFTHGSHELMSLW